MRTIGFLNLAALVASLMVLAIAAILIPDKSWSTTAIMSAILFALSVGFVFYIPSVVVKSQIGSDAGQMAAIGPLGVMTTSALLMTAGGFVLALLEVDKVAFALDIFAIGALIISGLILRGATNVISEVATQYSVPSKHIVWQGAIQGLHHIASDTQSKTALEQLAEKFRYVASDVPSGTPQDSSIDDAVKAIRDQLGVDSTADVQSQISKIEMLMAQREVFLRTVHNAF